MRYATDRVKTEFNKSSVRICWLVRMEMESGTLFFTTAPHDLEHGGAVWQSRLLQKVTGIESTSELKKGDAKLVFDALDSTMVALTANKQEYYNRLCQVYLAVLDANGQVEPDPVSLKLGRMMTHGIGGAKKSPVVTIDVQGTFAQVSKSNTWRTTKESHQRRFPDDKCLDSAADSQTPIEWGGSK